MSFPYRLLPPLGTLRAFEAAARLENFTLAADELCLTQSAVSRHVRSLEDSLGVQVFIRNNRTVRLTPDGRRLMEAVAITLSHLSLVTQDIRKRANIGDITVGMLTSQASLYVIPRMQSFRRGHPGVDLNIVAMERNPDPSLDDFDVSIVAGYHPDPNYHSEKIITEIAYPVCSPDYLEEAHNLKSAKDLCNETLLHLDESTFVGYPWHTPVNWSNLLSALDVELPLPKQGLTFSSYLMTVQAAIRGLGVAIGWHHIVDDYIQDGTLVRPLEISQEWDRHHYLVVPKNRLERPDIQAFCEWLKSEIDQTMGTRPPAQNAE